MGSRQESRRSEFGAGFINEAISIVARELPWSKWAAKKHVCAQTNQGGYGNQVDKSQYSHGTQSRRMSAIGMHRET